jgi:uncharacterized protein DUF7014/AbiJ-like protein
MAVFDIFSKREKQRQGGFPDTYQYDKIPDTLRVQVLHIWESTIGKCDYPHENAASSAYATIRSALCREYGKLFLWRDARVTPLRDLTNFFLNSKDTNKVLDVIELSFQGIDVGVRNNHHAFYMRQQSPDQAIEELNARFREHGVGYQFESGQIMRTDSQLIHAEIVKPALSLLTPKYLSGANEEFLKAHKHFRSGDYKECMNECLKAFESTLKCIFAERKWDYPSQATAKALINIAFDKQLVPSCWQAHFTALRTTLEAGVPTARNRHSGHGQGPTLVPIPESLAAYTLHLTASNIVFLVRLHKEVK